MEKAFCIKMTWKWNDTWEFNLFLGSTNVKMVWEEGWFIYILYKREMLILIRKRRGWATSIKDVFSIGGVVSAVYNQCCSVGGVDSRADAGNVGGSMSLPSSHCHCRIFARTLDNAIYIPKYNCVTFRAQTVFAIYHLYCKKSSFIERTAT